MSAKSDEMLAQILQKYLQSKGRETCPYCGSARTQRVTRGQIGWKECTECNKAWGDWID